MARQGDHFFSKVFEDSLASACVAPDARQERQDERQERQDSVEDKSYFHVYGYENSALSGHQSHDIPAKTRRNAKSAKAKSRIRALFIVVFALFASLRALREKPVCARLNNKNFHGTICFTSAGDEGYLL
jgi:hypothetical protein